MSLITFGFGATAALVLTLGFGLGQPPEEVGGSYITFGQGQSASKFVMLGLSPGTAQPPVEPPAIMGGGVFRPERRLTVEEMERRKLQSEDELMLFIAAASASLGLLDE